VRDVFFVAGHSEGAPSAFKRVVVAAFVKEDFSKAAIKPRRIWAVTVILSQKAQTVIERATVHGAGEGRTIDP
jgi:hypothetical protein